MGKKKEIQEIRSIGAEYDYYTTHVYPNGMAESQSSQIKQAFYAGAMVVFEKMLFIGSLEADEKDTSKVLDQLKNEVDTEIMRMVNLTMQ